MKSEILDHRNKYLAMLKGKDAAGVLPDDLNEMIRGFMPSRAVLTALELDVFTAVGEGGTASQIAGQDSMRGSRHRDAAECAGQSEAAGEARRNLHQHAQWRRASWLRDRLTALAAAQLHTANLWKRWSKLDRGRAGGNRRCAEARQRLGEALHRRHGSHRARPGTRRGASRGSERRQAHARSRRRLGRLLHRVCQSCASAASRDRRSAGSAAAGAGHIRKAGLADRISTRAGDMLSVPLEAGKYDLVLLSAICHMFSPEENQQLLQRAYAALAPQGRLVISDFILDADKTSPRFGALFALEYAGRHACRIQLQRAGICSMVEAGGLCREQARAHAGAGESDDCDEVRCDEVRLKRERPVADISFSTAPPTYDLLKVFARASCPRNLSVPTISGNSDYLRQEQPEEIGCPTQAAVAWVGFFV